MCNSVVKKTFLVIILFTAISLACDLSFTVASPTGQAPLPTNTVIPATGVPTQVPATLAVDPSATALQSDFEGIEVAVDPLSIVLSPKLASGVRGLQIPAASGEGVAPWDVTPGHIQLKLEGYVLQGKSIEPEIYVYPAQAYAELYPAAFESIHRLDNILYVPGGPTLNDQLPAVPFFNAQQLFASNTGVISFQNGQGVRFVTEYAQYAGLRQQPRSLLSFRGSDPGWHLLHRCDPADQRSHAGRNQ